MAQELAQTVQLLNQDFLGRYPDEAARAASQLPLKEVAKLLRDQPFRLATTVWERLPIETCVHILPNLDRSLAGRLLSRSEPSRAVLVLLRLDEDERSNYLELLPAAKSHELSDLMRYPEDSAAHAMDTHFLTLRAEMTVREARAQVRQKHPHFTHQLFLVDDHDRLSQMIDIHDLLVAKGTERLGALAMPVPAAVPLTANREQLVEQLNQHKLADLPVIDFEGRLAGIVRYQALLNALSEERSADILTMVGAGKDERALSSTAFAVKKRLGWLEINLLTAFLASAVVGLFEDTIARFTALAVLLPVVAGQSGNTGAQALAVTMRGLAVREIGVRHWPRVVRKEAAAGLINGIAIALTTSLAVFVWSGSFGLAMVIALSMVASMVIAGLAGAVTPLVLSALGQDPAQSSSIILTTVTDVSGFFSFLGIATAMSGLL